MMLKVERNRMIESSTLFERASASPHKLALLFYVIIVLGHFGEHIAQMVQVFVLEWPRVHAHGILGIYFPKLVVSEALHFTYNLVQLVGLLLLHEGMGRRSRRWWNIAIVGQSWHFFEHFVLEAQWLTGIYLFGAAKQTSILELWFPRAELHFAYNVIVFIPTMVAIYCYLRHSD